LKFSKSINVLMFIKNSAKWCVFLNYDEKWLLIKHNLNAEIVARRGA